ncbi:hypothetical protein OAA55_00765 [bacterium]|nr:hypothetical protein [bacterium]
MEKKSRTQLNIVIDPDLLRQLKQKALESNNKLSEFINSILSDYISGLKNASSLENKNQQEILLLKQRISLIENK